MPLRPSLSQPRLFFTKPPAPGASRPRSPARITPSWRLQWRSKEGAQINRGLLLGRPLSTSRLLHGAQPRQNQATMRAQLVDENGLERPGRPTPSPSAGRPPRPLACSRSICPDKSSSRSASSSPPRSLSPGVELPLPIAHRQPRALPASAPAPACLPCPSPPSNGAAPWHRHRHRQAGPWTTRSPTAFLQRGWPTVVIAAAVDLLSMAARGRYDRGSWRSLPTSLPVGPVRKQVVPHAPAARLLVPAILIRHLIEASVPPGASPTIGVPYIMQRDHWGRRRRPELLRKSGLRRSGWFGLHVRSRSPDLVQGEAGSDRAVGAAIGRPTPPNLGERGDHGRYST